MTRNQFDFEFGKKHGVNSFQLTDELTVFRKGYEIWNENTDESIYFKNVDELLNYELESGLTVWDLVENREHLYGDLTLHGGRGSGSGNNKTHSWRGAGGSGFRIGEGNNPYHFPAEANVNIKTKTYDEALKEFSKKYASADHEYAYEVDMEGFVHRFHEGGTSSVHVDGMTFNKKTAIIHNHPSGSTFSPPDLLNMATTQSGGVVAVGSKYTYSVFKTDGRFKSNEFVKMIKKAEKNGVKGKDMNDGVHQLLKANQKKYGYRYTREKTKI